MAIGYRENQTAKAGYSGATMQADSALRKNAVDGTSAHVCSKGETVTALRPMNPIHGEGEPDNQDVERLLVSKAWAASPPTHDSSAHSF